MATRMFDARGPEGFTMRELAAELGVSAMTPYR
ncbi:MAG TPA: TetR family transcriptional regulator, partial [Candidatus Binatia bacterium]|nr:TetR family transcriptional regulator [Candidatus Binatia bacterium]